MTGWWSSFSGRRCAAIRAPASLRLAARGRRARFCALALVLTSFATPAGARPIDRLDPHRLPLGDGKISAQPQRGYVFSCRNRFFGGRGAVANVPWIHGDRWDLTQKLAVQGAIHWPQAVFAIALRADGRAITGNGLPVDQPTGRFPIAPTDPAYRLDRNPNAIRARDLALLLPRDPAVAAAPSCVPMGMIGIALNGVAIFNALDDAGRDAVAHEVQDACSGHPQMRGVYHYHGPSRCLPGLDKDLALIGYALDGFGIFSRYGAEGREVTDADLDECHGRVDTMDWDGRRVSMYHYTMTRDYPYTIGCFRGVPVPVPGASGR